MRDFYESLCEAAGGEAVRADEPMAAHTTFRTGGKAAFFAAVQNEAALRRVTLLCRERGVPFYLLGNGSNLLVGSRGYDGVMIKLEGEFLGCSLEKDRDAVCEKDGNKGQAAGGRLPLRTAEDGSVTVCAGAGILLSRIGRLAMENGLTGFEFAAGIPGTLGGAVVMNAGAYGGEMKDILSSVRVMEREGQIRELPAQELALSYRHSCVPERGLTVLSARLTLRKGEEGRIRARMEELSAARREKQPLEYPSAGSTFKRPEGYFAGKLIQDAGLKGYSVGGAQVSEKHAGFVINRNQATPEDIRALIEEVQKRVWETSGVCLEPEVKFLGFENENRQQELFRGRQEADGAEKE